MIRLIQRYLNKPENSIVFLLFAGIAGYSVCNAYGFLIFPDEFTYWSYAGTAAGYDWSPATSLGAYYSYGYSLILTPVFILCKNPVTAYRVAVGINFVLLFGAMLCLVKMTEKLYGTKRVPIVLFATSAVLYAGHLFSAQMTLTETMLLTLYIVIGLLVYHYLESNSVLSLILLEIALIYIYIVHMRTIGIVLSALIILFFHMLSKQGQKKHLILAVTLMGVLFAASCLIKEWSYETVFGGMNRELVSGNDYSGQLAKIRYIFTRSGFYDTAVHILGKFLYLGLSTFGIFVFGIYGFIKKVFTSGVKVQVRRFSAYILLTVAAQILIGTIYLLTLGEISDYTYGRYNELILPFVMVEGMCTIWQMGAKKLCAAGGGIALWHMFCTSIVVRQIYDIGADNFCGYFMPGICWHYDADHFSVSAFYTQAYLIGTLAMVLVMMIFLWSRGGRDKFIICLLTLELMTAVKTDRTFLHLFKQAAYRDYQLAGRIEEVCKRGENTRILFRYEAYPSYIGILQFMMKDKRIEVTGQVTEQDLQQETILVFAFDDTEQEKWMQKFTYRDVYGHFSILYD